MLPNLLLSLGRRFFCKRRTLCKSEECHKITILQVNLSYYFLFFPGSIAVQQFDKETRFAIFNILISSCVINYTRRSCIVIKAAVG